MPVQALKRRYLERLIRRTRLVGCMRRLLTVDLRRCNSCGVAGLGFSVLVGILTSHPFLQPTVDAATISRINRPTLTSSSRYNPIAPIERTNGLTRLPISRTTCGPQYQSYPAPLDPREHSELQFEMLPLLSVPQNQPPMAISSVVPHPNRWRTRESVCLLRCD